jgi:DNA-binding response OmpR family regulator
MKPDNSFALIVEDDEDLAQIFTEASKTAGYLTENLGNGSQAFTWLKEHTPQIVVLDLHLPGVLGIELLKFIRAAKHLGRTRVIVITGDSVGAEEVRETADFVLIKPVSFMQLRDLAARLRPAPLVG